jgi:uncharacterized protein (TIGR03382 family)
MNRTMKFVTPAGLVMLALTPAAHAIVNWSNPTGSTPLFSWAGGYSNNGLFGNPTVNGAGDSFIFTPTTFTATNPGAPTATDTLQVTITVQPGQTINDVIISEVGSRSSTNRTTIQGTLRVKDLTAGSLTDITQSMVYNNGVGDPIPWSGSVAISSLGFGGGLVFQVTLTNNLSAILSGQSITKTGVEIHFTPTPGALAVAGLAAATLARRRRAR